MNKFLVAALIFIFVMPASAKFMIKDASGKMVEWIPPDSPWTRFQKSMSYEEYQNLNQIERSFVLPTVLMASLNPDAGLDAAKKVHVQNILSQHFYTLPPKVAKEITDRALWQSFVGPAPGVTEALLKKFGSAYPKERSDDICNMIRAGVSMSSNQPQPTAADWAKVPEPLRERFVSIVSSEKNLTDDKCALSAKDTEPLSLKQMVQEINKKNAVGDARAKPANTLPPAKQTVCTVADIRSVFVEAIDKIEKNGPKHKVYLGVATMKCPIYGVVVQSANKQYKFYPDTYREDSVPAITFSSVDDVVSRLKTPEELPQPEVKREKPVSPFGAVR